MSGLGSGNEQTVQHIRMVQTCMLEITNAIARRGVIHDASKLLPPEVDAFNSLGDNLKGLTYGSPEYRRILREQLGPAIEHHYAANSHHPEYYSTYTVGEDGRKKFAADGISKMSLLDLIEMLADWKVAGQRHTDGSLFESFRVNRRRFAIPKDLYVSLINTAFELKWLHANECTILLNEQNEEEEAAKKEAK